MPDKTPSTPLPTPLPAERQEALNALVGDFVADVAENVNLGTTVLMLAQVDCEATEENGLGSNRLTCFVPDAALGILREDQARARATVSGLRRLVDELQGRLLPEPPTTPSSSGTAS
jgi:hypothetical protein